MSPRLLTARLGCAFVAPLSADPNGHAEDDAFWADAAALLPGFDGPPAAPAAPNNQAGTWSAKVNWPHTPVSISHLPDGRLLTFSGQEPKHWPGTKTQTYWTIWNPENATFESNLYLNHEMFCGAMSLRTDGVLQIMGGRYTVRDSSTFDWRDNQWGRVANMFDPRWYTSSLALPDGDIFTVSGSGGPNTAERYVPETNAWRRLGGINWQPVATATGFEANWTPFIFVAPDGRIFHFGPTRQMNWVSADGTGSMVSAGIQVPTGHYPKDGGVVMYESGKFLFAGGTNGDAETVSNRCFTVDLNTTPPTVATTGSLRFARRFQNAVVLPTGEVMVMGGNTSGLKFSDVGSVLTPEIWNPRTGTWRNAANQSIPRNYHSTAILLPDGRVYSGGGGYDAGNPDATFTHPDAQLYTPPSLFQSNGSAATRPVITSAPAAASLGSVFEVQATAGLSRFTMIRMMAITHGYTTDQRFLNVPFTESTPGRYHLVAHPNANVMLPGYWMIFGLNAQGTYSKASIIHIKETIDAPNSGLLGTYHDGITLNNPKLTRTDSVIDFAYGSSSPSVSAVGNDTWSTSWNGWLIPDFTETHNFHTFSDDGVRLWVNGQLIINNWTPHGVTEDTGSIALTAGVPVSIRLEHYEDGGDATIRLLWSSPRTPKNLVPSRVLRSSPPENEAVIAADNRHELYINGKLAAIGTDWSKALRTAFTTSGSRATIAIRATDAAGVAGVIGQFRINGQTLVTNSNWKVATSAPAGWQNPGFDDSAWTRATDYGPIGSAPWTTGPEGLPTGSAARWIWSADRNAHDEIFLRFTFGTPDFITIADRVSTTGQIVDLTPSLTNSNLTGLTFAATNLPPGLGIQPATGRITGTLNGQGVFPVVLRLQENGVTLASTSFTWTVRLPGQGGGSILRELWTNIPGSTLADLTSNSRFPNSPDLRDSITAFPVGVNSADNYGTRLRGYIHAPVTGTYLFWLATDDFGSLRLSTNENPANAREIASIEGWTNVAEWTKFPTQQSATINLSGGERYYFEILQKEGGGGDHINLAWQRPGDTERSVIDSSYLSPFISNRAPTLQAIADRATTAGTGVTLRPTAADPDGDPLSFTATGLPAGLLINPSTGEIYGIPVIPSTATVVLTATDPSGATASSSFLWAVNPPLEISAPRLGIASVNDLTTFIAPASGGTGVSYRWNFGDGSPAVLTTTPQTTHQFTRPGRFIITLTAIDASGIETTITFPRNVRPPIIGGRPAASQGIVTSPGVVWTVNPDHGTVSALDTGTGAILAEIPTGKKPSCLAFAPDGSLWVTNKDDSNIAVIDPATRTVTRTLPLPRGSAPFGIIFPNNQTHAFVALEAAGLLAKIDATTGALVTTSPTGPHPRHLSSTHDGATILVSRFITPPAPGEATVNPSDTLGGGEILRFRSSDLTLLGTTLLAPSTEPDSGGGGRGLPNYLGPAVISPAGDFAWVPSKQDNIQRGTLRDSRDLTHDSTVRAITSVIDLGDFSEVSDVRIDHDDGSVPSTAIFDNSGLFLFVALEGSRQVAVVDAYGRNEFMRIPVGRAPQGLTLSPDGGVLFVHNFMDRSVSLIAVADITDYGTPSATTLATLNSVSREALPAEVFRGKQLFYDAADDRIALQDYISCASCHNDGGHDGRVWDFTGFGEGLRNTTDLRGRAGTAHGPLHWSGNFDEVQDFENQLRSLAGGDGLIVAGSPHAPLATANAGRSADLDALAAYVTSLGDFSNSPHRNSDGSMTAAASRGRNVFIAANCASCHSGTGFTDSGSAPRHDIGTLKPSSGSRLGAALDGIDTPTLRGLHDGAPYLHDGSAASLAEAIAAHDGITLSSEDSADLVAYLLQIEESESAAPAPGAPAILSFTASPATLTSGASSTLSWSLQSGGSPLSSLTLNGTDVSNSSSIVVSPNSTTSYTLAATNSAGTTTATLTVQVEQAVFTGTWGDWLTRYNLPASPAADSDGDSLPAGIEFALGLDPTRGDSLVSTVPGADPAISRAIRMEETIRIDGARRFDLVFTRPKASLGNDIYWLEGTLDLEQGWGIIGNLNGSGGSDIPQLLDIIVTDLGDGTEEVRAGLHGFTSAYLRLAVNVGGSMVRSAPFGWLRHSIHRLDNLVSPPFAHEALAGGAFIPAADGLSLTHSGAAWTADQWVGHYAQITTGPATGALLEISSNTAGTLRFAGLHPALAARLAASGGGNYVIRRTPSLASLFGRFNESGLLPGGPGAGDTLSRVNPDGSFSDYYYRTEGIGGIGWRSVSDPFASAADALLPPGDGIIINHPSEDPLDLWFHGEVVLGQRLRVVRQGFTILGSQTPVERATLATLGLDSFFLVSPDGNNDSNLYLDTPWGLLNGHFRKDDSLPGGTGWRKVFDSATPVDSTTFGPAAAWAPFRFGAETIWERPQPFSYSE
jgi:YVTN family beta-propeller protein